MNASKNYPQQSFNLLSGGFRVCWVVTSVVGQRHNNGSWNGKFLIDKQKIASVKSRQFEGLPLQGDGGQNEHFKELPATWLRNYFMFETAQ